MQALPINSNSHSLHLKGKYHSQTYDDMKLSAKQTKNGYTLIILFELFFVP